MGNGCESKDLVWMSSVMIVQLGPLLALPAIASLQGELAHGVILQGKIHVDLPGKVGGIYCNNSRERAWTDYFCQNAFGTC